MEVWIDSLRRGLVSSTVPHAKLLMSRESSYKDFCVACLGFSVCLCFFAFSFFWGFENIGEQEGSSLGGWCSYKLIAVQVSGFAQG